MTVLLLGPYPPPHGGVQTNLVAIRQFLLERRIPCSVINLTRHRRPDAGGIYYPSTGAGVVQRMLALRPEIIHLHFGGTLSRRLLGLCIVSTLIPGARVVLTFHSGGYPSSPAGKAAHPRSITAWILRRLDAVIGVNQELVDFFRRLGVPDERARLISPYTFSTEPSEAPLPDPLGSFYRAHNPRLITVSGLEPEYDLPSQIQALGLVRQRHPEAGLAIIGAGRREAEIRAVIAAVPYSAHVLLCGDMPHAVTLRAVSESNLFLRTTLYDGDAISVREALQLGLPVIATDNGMRPPGVHLAPISDAQALARAIEQQLADVAGRPGNIAPGGEQNLQAVVDLYSELIRRP